MTFTRKFKSGDTVFHRPTGETWSLIADEKDGWVTPGGWPPSQGRAEDCKLVEAKTEVAKIEWDPETHRWDVMIDGKSVHASPELWMAQKWCKRNGLSSEANIVTT